VTKDLVDPNIFLKNMRKEIISRCVLQKKDPLLMCQECEDRSAKLKCEQCKDFFCEEWRGFKINVIVRDSILTLVADLILFCTSTDSHKSHPQLLLLPRHGLLQAYSRYGKEKIA